MKKILFLTLLLAMFMVSCQDNMIGDLEETSPRISRSPDVAISSNKATFIKSTADALKSRYVVKIRNSYYNPYFPMVAVRWEVFDMSYQPVHDVTVYNESGVVCYDGAYSELVGYFEIAPGEYIVEAYAENLSYLETECAVMAEDGGEICFELINGVGEAAWAEPVFTPAR